MKTDEYIYFSKLLNWWQSSHETKSDVLNSFTSFIAILIAKCETKNYYLSNSYSGRYFKNLQTKMTTVSVWVGENKEEEIMVCIPGRLEESNSFTYFPQFLSPFCALLSTAISISTVS